MKEVVWRMVSFDKVSSFNSLKPCQQLHFKLTFEGQDDYGKSITQHVQNGPLMN